MKAILLRLEPLIWTLFGAGMMVGGLLLPALILVLGLAAPFGLVPESALAFERMHGLAASLPGRLLLAAAVALPLWAGAHHLRHVWIDFGGLKSDALVGSLLYALALVGSVLGVVAAIRL